jgi:hypothetical protein
MSEALRLPGRLSNRRIITPVATLVMAIAFVATLALGFGLRTWTEDTSRPSTPAGAEHQVRTTPTEPLRQIGKPW